MDEPTQTTGVRRLALLGAGPLPSAEAAEAPGVANRLWNFLAPAAATGVECLALLLEAGAPPLGDRAPEPVESADGLRWSQLRLGIEDFKRPERLAGVIDAFAPDALVGAGTLQAGATACALAGERPVWVDLFGDPLAEIQTKAGLLGEGFNQDEQLFVWELMLAVLLRGDAFSTVSRRQRDALLGQLLLLGMTDGAGGGAALFDLIQPMPCAVAALGAGGAMDGEARAQWRGERGLPPDAEVVLWSGGFNAWADPATLIGAMDLLMARRPRLHLVATGGALPGYLSRVFEEADRLARVSDFAERIHLPGWLRLAEAEGWAAAANVGVVVDRPCAETRLGARNRLLTFVGADLPIVATRGTEVVEEMEMAGALVGCEPGRAAALATAIERVLDSPAEAHAMAGRARAFAGERYIFEATARPFLRWLESGGALPGAGDAEAGWAGDRPSAAETIAGYIDPERRRADWEELARYRAGRVARMREWLRGNFGG